MYLQAFVMFVVTNCRQLRPHIRTLRPINHLCWALNGFSCSLVVITTLNLTITQAST